MAPTHLPPCKPSRREQQDGLQRIGQRIFIGECATHFVQPFRRVIVRYAREEQGLVAESRIKAGRIDTHDRREVVKGDTIITARKEKVRRLRYGPVDVELTRATAFAHAFVFCNLCQTLLAHPNRTDIFG